MVEPRSSKPRVRVRVPLPSPDPAPCKVCGEGAEEMCGALVCKGRCSPDWWFNILWRSIEARYSISADARAAEKKTLEGIAPIGRALVSKTRGAGSSPAAFAKGR